MFLIGHIGFTVFLSVLFYLPASYAFIGVLIPDIVDKLLLASGLTSCGRLFSHSIFFSPILGLSAYAITRRRGLALAIAFGSFLHLLEDATYFVPWFYPIIDYTRECKPFEIYYGMFELVTDVAGLGLLMATVKLNSKLLYYRDLMWLKIFKNGFPRVPYVQKQNSATRSLQK